VTNLLELHDQLLLYLNFLIEFVERDPSIQSIGKRCHEISRHYRALGICSLLVEGDIDEFFHNLIRSAQTRQYFLDRCRQENYLSDFYLAASFNGPFFDAVAANQFQLAGAIARLSPQEWHERDEYEDDFAYAHFLHGLVLNQTEGLAQGPAILERFERALEGPLSPRLAVCKAMLTRDTDDFESAFGELLAAREAEMAAARLTVAAEEETFEPESGVFVEGLALLKLAGRLGVTPAPEHTMCPSMARRTDYRPFVPDGFPNRLLE
jgi:hypothetical protein